MDWQCGQSREPTTQGGEAGDGIGELAMVGATVLKQGGIELGLGDIEAEMGMGRII